MSLRYFFTAILSSLVLGHALSAHAGTVHVHTSGVDGFHTHSVWYDDGQEVTVVDTQFTPALAEALIADIQHQTKSPITRVIVTHPNPDKFNGLSVFHARGAISIASERTASAIPLVDAYKRAFWTKVVKAFTDETYPKIEPVKKTFRNKTTIRLKSGETLTLFELAKPGVSSDQVVVRIDRSGDLVVGDLVAHRAHAWLEGGIINGAPVPTIEGWKDDLRALASLGRGTVYGGRGLPAPVAEVIPAQIAYLERANTIVADYVAGLGKEGGAMLADPASARTHYAVLQKRMATAFPDYALPDLIGYGVYGLARQAAATKR